MNGGLDISRRAFLICGVAAAGSVLLAPKDALAISPVRSSSADAFISLEDGSSAQEKWDEAVRRAREEGGEVFFGQECEGQESGISTCSSSRTVNASKGLYIGAVYDTVIISANYGVTSANRISPFNWAKIYCSASSVASSSYDRAVLDNGRTIALYFHAEIKGVGGWPTYVGDFYAEFYYTYSGSIS